MPTYVYKFVDTGETIEVQQAFTDEALTEATHPGTGAVMPVKKVFTPVGVTFKGGGFYKTDSRGGSSRKAASGASDASGGSSGESEAAKPSGSATESATSSSSTASSSSSSTPSTPSTPSPPSSSSGSVD
jgi:predicted nucleic acid-binding Zn ribbon protein